MSRRKIIVLVALLIGVAACVPFPTTIVPEWKLQVLNLDGMPCESKRVEQNWAHFSLDSTHHLDGRLSDQNGYVVFPERTIWAPSIWRIVRPIPALFLAIFAHGDFGISVSVDSSGLKEGNKAWLSWKPGQPLSEKITVEECTVDQLRPGYR